MSTRDRLEVMLAVACALLWLVGTAWLLLNVRGVLA